MSKKIKTFEREGKNDVQQAVGRKSDVAAEEAHTSEPAKVASCNASDSEPIAKPPLPDADDQPSAAPPSTFQLQTEPVATSATAAPAPALDGATTGPCEAHEAEEAGAAPLPKQYTASRVLSKDTGVDIAKLAAWLSKQYPECARDSSCGTLLHRLLAIDAPLHPSCIRHPTRAHFSHLPDMHPSVRRRSAFGDSMFCEQQLDGWSVICKQRGSSAHVDRYFKPPTGEVLRSRLEVARFLGLHPAASHSGKATKPHSKPHSRPHCRPHRKRQVSDLDGDGAAGRVGSSQLAAHGVCDDESSMRWAQCDLCDEWFLLPPDIMQPDDEEEWFCDECADVQTIHRSTAAPGSGLALLIQQVDKAAAPEATREAAPEAALKAAAEAAPAADLEPAAETDPEDGFDDEDGPEA